MSGGRGRAPPFSADRNRRVGAGMRGAHYSPRRAPAGRKVAPPRVRKPSAGRARSPLSAAVRRPDPAYNARVGARLLPLLLLVAGAARADFVVEALAAAPVRGISLTRAGDEISVSSPEGATVRVRLDDVVEVTSAPAPAAPAAAAFPFEVELVDGSLLRGTLRGSEEGSLLLQSPSVDRRSGPILLRIELLRSLRNLKEAEGVRGSRMVRLAERDVAYRATGARVEGIVARFTATGVEMERPGEAPIEVGYDQLAALFVDNPAAKESPGRSAVVRTADGGALRLAADFRIAAGVIEGNCPAGLDGLSIPASQLVQIAFRGGGFVALSELAAARIDREPFFPLPQGAGSEMLEFLCPVRRDRSPDGRAITLGGRRFFQGFGVRPKTTIEFELPGAFREFRAYLGIDDEIFLPGYGRNAGAGSVVFSVLVDGKQAYASEPVVGGKPPVEVRVPIEGARRLSLVVSLVPAEKSPGGKPDSPELDNAVWARPLLVR